MIRLTALTRILDDEVRLAEAFGLPEITALGDSERQCRLTLQTKAKAILEDPKLSPPLLWFRRRFGSAVELDEIELTFVPPKRQPEWQEPVVLRLPLARWEEDGLHQAWVPAVGVLVYATRAALLPDRVKEHVQLVLAGRQKQVTLRELARLARIRSLDLSTLEVGVSWQTPRQLAAANEAEGEEPSILAKLAEELAPCVATGNPAPDADRSAPFAFELEAELAQLAEALGGPPPRSVLLVAPAGAGKTALVHELARRRRDFALSQTPFWSTSGARLMMGPTGFGMWQERCQQMCREAARTKAVVHLGNLTELLEVGKAGRSDQSVGSFLRSWIARGEITVICECTLEQVSFIERLEPHLLGALRQVNVPARTPAQTRAILRSVYDAAAGRSGPAESRRGVEVALDRLHQLHLRYATYSANPGRAVRFLRNLLGDRLPEEALAEEQVVAGFARETGLPLVLLDDREPLDLAATEAWFSQRVIGQPEAVARVLDVLALIKARLARPHKPLASFLFLGPTGTGKTELAKALATFLFGDPGRLVRFDLNEFGDPVSVLRLIGGPGTDDAEGLLTAKVREQPFSVLLLDEFEKADPSLFDLLLQVLGEGRLTDAAGRVADFCNSVIVMTSNIGARAFQRGPAGFRADGAGTLDAREHFTSAVQEFLRPELFNRLDAVVPFQPLSPDIVLAIARRQLDLVCQRDGLRLRPVELQINAGVAEHLATRGYEVRYGARPLKRAVERELLVPLAEALNAYETTTPVRAEVRVTGGRLRIGVRGTASGMGRSELGAQRAQSELVSRIVEQRRRIGRLSKGGAVGVLENRVTMLTSLERRLARAGERAAAADPQLAGLGRLRACLDGVGKLARQACDLEDQLLASVYRGETPDRAACETSLDGITAECRRLQREVFRLQRPGADEVVLAFYSEHQATLLQFACAYRALAAREGRLVRMDCFVPPPGGRSAVSRLVREFVGRPEHFFAKPPQNLIGIALHIHGDLFRPRFGGEAGLHEFHEKHATHVCLIDVAPPPLSHYTAPKGVERKGGIEAQGAGLVRRFDRQGGSVEDMRLGRRPWLSAGIERCVSELTDEQLNIAIDEATG